MKEFYILIISLGNVGFIKNAPGTLSGIVYLPLCIILTRYFTFFYFCIALCLIFIIGIVALYKAKIMAEDPSFVVIDEFLGQGITFLPISNYLYHASISGKLILFYILGFLFFRVLDITKIGPIKYIDKKLKNPYGIMLDDVIAGCIASFTLLEVYKYIM